MECIILGLSDGVDSCVAGALLKRQGFEVIGVYLKNGGEKELSAAERNACEAGIAFEVVDIHNSLDENVCKPFIDEYLRGRTPSPCPGCNRNVKLKALIDRADTLGIRSVATGHYVLKSKGRLFMGSPECDQSYMLSLISNKQLDRLLLPLGAMSKTEVRRLAAELGFSCASKPDSRENCFIKEDTYSQYIKERSSEHLPPAGDVLLHGHILSKHEGIYHYTVGQRWKEDYEGRRLYISRIDPTNDTVELCLWEELFTCEIDLSNLNWLYGVPPSDNFSGQIRIRHTRWETPECRFLVNGRKAHIISETPLRAPAPGQTAAFYMGDLLIGGGIVESVAADYPLPDPSVYRP